MPKNLTPQNQWETQFDVPLPGEPRSIGPLEVLFQKLLNRTERLKGRIAEVLGLPWDAAPPDTIAGLHGRVGALEAAQGGTTLSAHRTAPVLDHPDGSVTIAKLAAGLGYGPNAFVDPNAYYNQTGQNYPMQVGEVARFDLTGTLVPLRVAIAERQIYELILISKTGASGGVLLYPNGTTYTGQFRETVGVIRPSGVDTSYSSSNKNSFILSGGTYQTLYSILNTSTRTIIRISQETTSDNTCIAAVSAFEWAGAAPWMWLGTVSPPVNVMNHMLVVRRLA